MPSLYRQNPLSRFDGLAQVYARCRPSYPEAAIDHILTVCNLGKNSILVDVGCGTGISSRLFASHGVRVVGIEPNEEMRREAQGVNVRGDFPSPQYQAGQAEATGLPDAYCDVVLSAQAFHWFEPESALREFARILKPIGWVAIMWNERAQDDPFTAECSKIIRSTPGARDLETNRAGAGEVLLKSPRYEKAHRTNFPNEQVLDEEGLLGRALSASYAPREPEEVNQFTNALRQVFAEFQTNGTITLKYQTSVFCGQRKD